LNGAIYGRIQFSSALFIDELERSDNTVQIEYNEHLRRYMVVSKNWVYKRIAGHTAGGTSATVARRSHRTPLRIENTSLD
jgi:hypothetical protein